MPQEGMLLQLDGSHHRWLEDRGPRLTLLLAIDDATGTAPHALFSQVEDTRGYLSLLQGIIEAKGIPLAVYTDGHAVFANRLDFQDTVWEGKGGKLTQCSRALGELGITRIGAHSPEAKGRVERANGTFQDRLGNCVSQVPVHCQRRTMCWRPFYLDSIGASVSLRTSPNQHTVHLAKR